MPDVSHDTGRGRARIEVSTASAAMVVFGLFAHRGPPWIAVAAGGFLIAAATLARSLLRADRPAALLGLEGFSCRAAWFGIAGCTIGAGFGVMHRWRLALPLLPAGPPENFAALACLIGATEELIYRGWLQGRMRVFGWPAAVVTAALAHAAYKTMLFAWPSQPVAIDLVGLGLWTAAGGVIFGLLREFSRSLVPPLLAHAVFDLVTYGAVVHAPWWVWQ